jgi:hypothetical protein
MTSDVQSPSSVQQVSVETIEFPCVEWIAVRTAQGQLIEISPVAGTWTLLGGEDRYRFAKQGADIKAMFACPRCKQVGFISEGFDPPKALGNTKPLSELHCRKCQFGCRVILKDWDKRRLYCACFETCGDNTNTIITHKEYLHAENLTEALKFFWAQHHLEGCTGPGLEITNLVAIAPTVGFFAEKPKNDRILIV